jgi:probable poly-beta-1,6-N-acetyl-D-glucosamine export protein
VLEMIGIHFFTSPNISLWKAANGNIWRENYLKNRFLKHIHYFRGFAMLNVVIIHLWQIPAIYSNRGDVKLINGVRELAFHNSTLYLLFISGFLFQYLSIKFDLIKYYKHKIIHIILPYFLFTLVLVLIEQVPNLAKHEFSIFLFLKYLCRSLVFGSAKIQYWYIPFITIIFVFSPLILKIPASILIKLYWFQVSFHY